MDRSDDGFQAKGWRLPAHQIEQLVFMQVADFLRGRTALLDELRCKRKSPDFVSALLTRASKLGDVCDAGSHEGRSEAVAVLVRRVTVAQNQVTIEIDRKSLADRMLDQEAVPNSDAANHRPIMIKVPVRFRRRGVEAKFVVLDQQGPAAELDAKLVKARARAHDWFGRILCGEANGIGAIAGAEGLDRTYVTRAICLAFLAPEITKAILAGRQPTDLTVKRLVSSALKIPLRWPEQITFISSANPRASNS